MKKINKKTSILTLMIVLLLFAVYIGPFDGFRHGHYYEEYDCTQIAEEDWLNPISIENEEYEMEFSPVKKYLNGFSIYLPNQPEDNEGTLLLSVLDEREKTIDTIEVDLSKPKAGEWYKTYVNTELKKGKTYKLKFSSHDCKSNPYLQAVNDDYLPDETVTGNILIAYSYARSTFNFQERILIVILIFSLEILLAGLFISNKKKILNITAICTLLTVLLSWNYMHNSMDTANTMYNDFQIDSEILVTSVITGERNHEYYRNEEETGYGLGNYFDLKGSLLSYDRSYITDDNWNEGYSRSEPAFIINSNKYTKEAAIVGNIVGFSNGEEYAITEIQDDDSNIKVFINNDSNLIPLKYGSLDDVVFYDANHNALHKGLLTAYKSQYGLHGKIFRHLSRYMEEDEILNNLYLICSLAAAVVFVLITLLVAYKFNITMAVCYFVTFWLSPWIINFARNLYWVEFTWFIPMLVGLFCAWKIDNKKCRVISYIAAFLSICIKSLCGYEYISVVMMGLIGFLLVDAMVAIFQKNKERSILTIRTIIIVGLLALAGFMMAIIIHARLLGSGNIAYGIRSIIEKDVLRRTSGADLNDFDPAYWPSFNASIWATYSKYFKFETQIITGIDGNLFPLLCIIPLCIYGVDYKSRRLNPALPIMYVVFFLTSISWFCLAKGHSYIHTHMNYVLWYFGFVQICFYTIVEKIETLIKRNDMKEIQ